ncbi:MAG: hypothetical protein O3A51_12840 [Verrucomicrobia bacterium]|nr:hypothetical protein [Verrucomicrobiota bacterium]
MKKILAAIVAVYVSWSLLDFVIHGILLGPTYKATADLWRPENEMMMGLMSVVTLVAAICFVGIYHCLCKNRSAATGLPYGVLFGLGVGFSAGYGTFSVMAIPHSLALGWMLAHVVEAAIGGLIIGAILKSPATPETTS